VPDPSETARVPVSTIPERFELAPEFQSAAKTGIGIQIALLVVTRLLLDGGELFRLTAIAAFGHLAGIVIIALRRRLSPTAWDLAFVRFGTPVSMVIVSWLAFALGCSP
jgi:hypothetical protein